MESGDFAVVGMDITEASRQLLPDGAGCGPGERIVVLPKAVLTTVLESLQYARAHEPGGG
jgi:hypothetical protein